MNKPKQSTNKANENESISKKHFYAILDKASQPIKTSSAPQSGSGKK
jgi:hypothetical protein